MAKLSLVADPSFSALVPISKPGQETPVKVSFIFKHRTRDGLKDFINGLTPDMADPDLIMNVATGWELDEAFTAENVAILCQNYHDAGPQVWKTYLAELTKARLGN